MEYIIMFGSGKDAKELHCGVCGNPSDYCDLYDSSEECFEDITPDIIADCEIRGYNQDEIDRVLSWYENRLSNSDVKWKDIYFLRD